MHGVTRLKFSLQLFTKHNLGAQEEADHVDGDDDVGANAGPQVRGRSAGHGGQADGHGGYQGEDTEGEDSYCVHCSM